MARANEAADPANQRRSSSDKKSESVLIFCLDDDDIGDALIYDAYNQHIVTLDSSHLGTEAHGEARKNVRQYSDFISSNDHKYAKRLLENEWAARRESAHTPGLHYYEYAFSLYYTPCIFWEIAIRKAIGHFQPAKILVPDTVLKPKMVRLPEDPLLDEESIIRLLRAIVLHRCTATCAETLPRGGIYKRNRKKSLRSTIRLVRPGRVLTKLLLSAELLPGYLSYFPVQVDKSQKSTKPLLIVAQALKARKLTNDLRLEKIKFDLLSYSELYEKIDALLSDRSEFEFRICVPERNDPGEILAEWLGTLSNYHDRVLDPCIPLLLAPYNKLFITDGDHCPVIRRIDNYIKSQANMWTCTIPEGGFDMYQYAGLEVFRLKDHDRLLRCTISERSMQHASDMWGSRARKLVIGYETRLKASGFIGRFVHRLLLALRITRGKPIIFYDYPYRSHSDLGICRTNCSAYAEVIRNIQAMCEYLALHEYLVLTNAQRGAEIRPFAGPRFIVSTLHWSLLASVADIVISTDSSIISECLNIQRPVVVWNPDTKRTNPLKYLTTHCVSKCCVMEVNNKNKLGHAIAMASNVNNQDFTAYKSVMSDFNSEGLRKFLKQEGL